MAWQDGRSGTSQDVYGARVSQAGAVLDPTGIPISSEANDQSATSVAFDGSNYLVAWQDGRSGTSQDVYGARVSQAGAVLDPTGIPISACSERRVGAERRFWRHELPRRVAGHTVRQRCLRRAGEPGRDGARSERHRRCDRGRRTACPERHVRRHELPRRLAGRSICREQLRHLRSTSKPGRSRSRSGGTPHFDDPERRGRRLRSASTAPTISWPGRTTAPARPITTFTARG